MPGAANAGVTVPAATGGALLLAAGTPSSVVGRAAVPPSRPPAPVLWPAACRRDRRRLAAAGRCRGSVARLPPVIAPFNELRCILS